MGREKAQRRHYHFLIILAKKRPTWLLLIVYQQELVTLSHLDTRKHGGWEMWAQAGQGSQQQTYAMERAFAIFAKAKHRGWGRKSSTLNSVQPCWVDCEVEPHGQWEGLGKGREPDGGAPMIPSLLVLFWLESAVDQILKKLFDKWWYSNKVL